MRILYVENDPVFAAVVSERFLAEHEVVNVATVAAARAQLDADVFDAVLCDYDLDDGKGDAVVRLLRERGFAGTIVAVSSHDAGNEALVAAGCDSVCPKLRFDRIAEHLVGSRSG